MRFVLQMEKISLPPLIYPSFGKGGFDREPRKPRGDDESSRRRAAVVAITVTLTALAVVALLIYALGTYAFLKFMWSFLSLGQFSLPGDASRGDDGIKTSVGVGEDSASIYVKSEGGAVNIRLIVGGPRNAGRDYDPGGGEEDDDLDVNGAPRQPPWCTSSSDCDTPPDFPLDAPPTPPGPADSTTSVPTNQTPDLPPKPADSTTSVQTHQTPYVPPDTPFSATIVPATPGSPVGPTDAEPDYLPVPDPWLRSHKPDYYDEGENSYFDHTVKNVFGAENDTLGDSGDEGEGYSDSSEEYDSGSYSIASPWSAYSTPDSDRQPLCSTYSHSVSLKTVSHKHMGVLMSWIKSPKSGTVVTVKIKYPPSSNKVISVFGMSPTFGRSSVLQVTLGHTPNPDGGMEVDVSWPRGVGGRSLLRVTVVSCQSSYLLSYYAAAFADSS
ncbi:ORF021 [Saltwater crocodilepox virus]|nr:hypothetical protein [Saltwater crocodilepox virus]QGT46460.1 ORF021 [Saltwater crocodilepox virus]QGT46676.1 ORF021 [Saltwater crocodilepox virus]QGT46893.1 ORF021 [Saltwater crocodilepox virus]QGT47106.1 ORF021 [Saltwater crocodilepox virus]